MTEKTIKKTKWKLFSFISMKITSSMKICKAVFRGIAELNSCTDGILSTPVFYLSLSLCVCFF